MTKLLTVHKMLFETEESRNSTGEVSNRMQWIPWRLFYDWFLLSHPVSAMYKLLLLAIAPCTCHCTLYLPRTNNWFMLSHPVPATYEQLVHAIAPCTCHVRTIGSCYRTLYLPRTNNWFMLSHPVPAIHTQAASV